MIVLIFWLSFILIFYTIIGYPVLITVLSWFSKKTITKKEITPRVTLIIAAYNEEKNIESKIKNSILLDYPKDELEIIVVSDGSNDETNNIITRYQIQGIKPLIIRERVGKTEAQNIAAGEARGEILLFSDATTIFELDVVRKIVRNFADPSIGCVTGKVQFSEVLSANIAGGLNIYAKYQRFIRQKQNYSSLIVATGCIYAIRKELFEPIEKGLVNDLVIPLKILEKGFKVAYEPEALVLVNRPMGFRDEFKRRTRIVLQGIRAIWSMRRLLNPFRYNFALSIISYRVLRWVLPILLIVLFAANLPLIKVPIYHFIFLFQIIFYCFAAVGFLLESIGCKSKFFNAPFLFCLMNAAALTAVWKLLKGEKGITWEPMRK